MDEVIKNKVSEVVLLPEKDQKWILCKHKSYVFNIITKKLKHKYTFYRGVSVTTPRPLLIKFQEDINELLANPLFVEIKKIGDIVEQVAKDIEDPEVNDLVEVEKDYTKEQLELLKDKALIEIIKSFTDDPIPKSKYDKINLILELQEKK